MKVESLIKTIDAGFYTGVPDSQLKALCDYLMNVYGVDGKHHIIAANEGNCAAIAAGYHLATGKIPVVYMQNSGIGNIINPTARLLNEKVYGITMIFIIGWRGEPGVPDEPQHIYQGEVTLKLLEDMEIAAYVIGKETQESEIIAYMEAARAQLESGKQIAFVIRKGALEYDTQVKYQNDYAMRREEIIQLIAEITGEDPVICTTGKASRELFEIRNENGQSHKFDFLTVGSMGHSSSIALGIAAQKKEKKVWIIDGDGALLMHMGAMAVIGANRPENLVHIVINNQAHETVGGQPTVVENVDITGIAKACGYPVAVKADSFEELDRVLKKAKYGNKLCLIEVHSALGARDNLGRPTTAASENKTQFMEFLSE